jgi:cytochrome c biogenesis protein CcmG, thiol:disulfide interchange protein DsbE
MIGPRGARWMAVRAQVRGVRRGTLAVRAALAALAALVTLVTLAAACGDPDAPPRSDLGEAPSYAAVTLDGDPVALADLRGEAVLLNVWATWCAPCRIEIPELQALHEEHADHGLRVVGVTVDSRHAMDDVRAFMDELGMTYDVWWDPDHSALNLFRASGVPFSALIDREGRIVWRHLGMFQRGDPALMSALERVLTRG